MLNPRVSVHDGVLVVRDDMYPGGTKARFIPEHIAGCSECGYATPAEGGAQTAIAHVARAMGKRATLFVAARSSPHSRTLRASRDGARIVLVRPGYLSCVRSRARSYCAVSGALLLPFGLDVPCAGRVIADEARLIDYDPDEVWCAGGSGVLVRALSKAWPLARKHVVQVGKSLAAKDVAGAAVHVHPLAYSQRARYSPPFPSDPHYDAKAWEMCVRYRDPSRKVLFWNVTGPA